ncbi:MAG: hypothetical protein HY716_03000 [Planctomycetes bacterium]|nr:hypothetical protein [Planctomycetota bacterium]
MKREDAKTRRVAMGESRTVTRPDDRKAARRQVDAFACRVSSRSSSRLRDAVAAASAAQARLGVFALKKSVPARRYEAESSVHSQVLDP